MRAKCSASKKAASTIFQNKLNIPKTEIETETAGCEVYFFADAFLNMAQSVYPECEVGGVVNWFMKTNTAKALQSGTKVTCEMIKTNPDDRAVLLYLQSKYLKLSDGLLNDLFVQIISMDEALRSGHLFLELTNLTARPGKKVQLLKPKGIFETLAGSALLMRRYRFQALNHLMYGEVHLIDPVIADTLCELRPPFLLDCYGIIKEELKTQSTWQELIVAYNNYAGKPLNELIISSPLELIGNAPDPCEYLQLCEVLETALQKKGREYFPRHLTLCKTLTRSNLMPRDDLGMEMGERNIETMPSTELRRRRAEMGTYNIWYTKFAAGQLCTSTVITGPGFVETANCLLNCNVVTPSDKHCIPLLPIYQAQTFALLKAFELNCPIILRLKRIHIVSHAGPTRISRELQNEITVDKNIPNAEYVVAGSEVLIYMPNSSTGRFEWVPKVPEDMPGLAVSAYSILDLTDQNPAAKDPGYGDFVHEGYYSQVPEEYFELIKKMDIVNLLNACSANHPVFVDNANELKSPQTIFEVGSSEYSQELECWSAIDKQRKNRVRINNQFKFMETLCGQKADTLSSATCNITFGQVTNLCTETGFFHFAEFYKLGEKLNFANRRYMAGTIKEI